MNTAQPYAPCIWVDADACSGAVKDVLYRTARRVEIEVAVVANQPIYVPQSEWIHLITVPHGANIADDRIIEMMQPGDLVITADIPLAARVVEKKGIALGHRGEVFDEHTVHSRLASRDLMEHFRSAGMETGGPAPFGSKDIQVFANALDRTLTQMFRPKKKS
ncbi:MAG: YaiI/YqxD family protein [Planctomycetaceae bacterium]